MLQSLSSTRQNRSLFSLFASNLKLRSNEPNFRVRCYTEESTPNSGLEVDRNFSPSDNVAQGKSAEDRQQVSQTPGMNLASMYGRGAGSFSPSFRNIFRSGNQNESETAKHSKPMDFVRGVVEADKRDPYRGSFGRFYGGRLNLEHDADFVHIKLLRNNTFVTVTDSEGNKKIGASSGCLPEMKGGAKISRYAAEATAEHVGRLARNMGINSVVVKVNGLTYFKKKRQAILSFREGFSSSRTDRNPIVFIEDTTRKPHNGCRLRKKRRY